MKKKIYKFLDNVEKYSPILAREIVETFVTDADDENVDYSFTVNGPTGQIYDEDSEPNTYFVFDTDGQTVLHDFKKALFDEDLSGLKEGSKEEEALMTDVREFLLSVCNIISEKHIEELRETIHRVVLGDKTNTKIVPLKHIRVVSVDLADYSSVPESSKYLLKIGKVPGSDINTDEVIKFIQSRQEKTGMDIDTVFSIEKKAGNPVFKNVEAILLGRKFLNEISIYFFVDYSRVPEKSFYEEKEEKIVDSKK